MTTRRGRLVAACALLGALAAGVPTSTAATTTPADVAATGPDDRPVHRFFFANAERSSATGVTDARRRMRAMTAQITRSRADLGVLAEVEKPQRRYFRDGMRTTWRMVIPQHQISNAVIYDSRAWRRIKVKTVTTSWNGKTTTPIVTLVDHHGFVVNVIAVHNPHHNPRATKSNDLTVLRAVLAARRHHIPTIVAGDLNNERASYCRFVARPYSMASAERPHGTCNRTRNRIDQALASPDLTWTSYSSIRSRATDHHHVYAATFNPVSLAD